MKSFFRDLFAKLLKHPTPAGSDDPPYGYPNDDDSTMEEAVASIWRWYERLGRQVQISVQGMGGSLEQYDIHDADFKDCVLFWEDANNPDRIEIHSEEDFRRCFLDWAKKRVRPFEDTGEFSFTVYALDDERLRH
ncbi:MAG: hypothetical protein ACO1TE_27640 [Prosthecobacter sp.]